MGLIAPLAALLGLEIENVAERAKAAAILYGLLALFSVLALVFLLVAAYLGLADVFNPLVSALILAGVFLLLAVAILIGAQIGKSQRHRQQISRKRSSETGALVTTAALTAVPVLMRAPFMAKLAVPVVALGAFALLRKKD